MRLLLLIYYKLVLFSIDIESHHIHSHLISYIQHKVYISDIITRITPTNSTNLLMMDLNIILENKFKFN